MTSNPALVPVDVVVDSLLSTGGSHTDNLPYIHRGHRPVAQPVFIPAHLGDTESL